jgi:hypothetical protein
MIDVVWFSRHAPSKEQLADLAATGHQIVGLAEGMALGAMSVNDQKDLDELSRQLVGLISKYGAQALYGVFATPMQAKLVENAVGRSGYGVSCFAAWNTSRSEEGGKPTFAHKAFLWVGIF